MKSLFISIAIIFFINSWSTKAFSSCDEIFEKYFETLGELDPKYQAVWEALFEMQPMQALTALKKIELPKAHKIAATVTISYEASKEIKSLLKQKRKKEAGEVFKTLNQSLNEISLDELLLKKVLRTLFTDEAFFGLLKKYRLAGYRSSAKILAKDIRKEIFYRKYTKTSFKSFFLSLYHFNKIPKIQSLQVLTLVAVSSLTFFFHDVATSPNTGTATKILTSIHGFRFAMFGDELIGWGIYFDKDEATKSLGEHFQVLKAEVINSRNNFGAASIQYNNAQDKYLRYLNERLYGGYSHRIDHKNEDSYIVDKASSYLGEQSSKSTGLAQQKTVIMHELLLEAGIDSVFEAGKTKSLDNDEDHYHLWLRLKGSQLVVDPTWGEIKDADRYYEIFLVGKPFEVNPDLSNVANSLPRK